MMRPSIYVKLTLAACCVLLVGVNGAIKTNEVCQPTIVESIPSNYNQNILYNPTITSVTPTHEAIIELINKAERTVKIATPFMKLTRSGMIGEEGPELTLPGKAILRSLKEAANRGVKIEILVDKRQLVDLTDIISLPDSVKIHYYGVRSDSEMKCKFIVVDDESFYIGSTDLVWYDFTLNKSFGLVFSKCKSMAKELDKIFQIYVMLVMKPIWKDNKQLSIPERLHLKCNIRAPISLFLEEANKSSSYKMCFAFSPETMANDSDGSVYLEGLLHVIDTAKKFVYISVSEYTEEYIFKKKHWPIIADAIRRASFERNVSIRLLLDGSTQSNQGRHRMWQESLASLNSGRRDISVVKLALPIDPKYSFTPDESIGIKKDSYVVSDKALWVGASSLVPEQIIQHTVVGMLIKPKHMDSQLRNQVVKIFARDFYSRYSTDIMLSK